MNIASIWQPEMVNRLRGLHADGLSGSQMAAALNTEFKASFTRNAIIGKLHRIGLHNVRPPFTPEQRAERRNTGKRLARRPASPRRTSQPPRPLTPLDLADDMTPDAVRDLPPDSSAFAVTFEQLAAPHCRFPIGDSASLETLTFCGADKMAEGPYCPRHFRLTHTRATRQSSVRWAPSWRVA